MANLKKSPKPTKNYGARIKNFIQENLKILLFMLFFFILNLALLYLKKDVLFTGKVFILAVGITIIANILLCAFLLFIKRKKWPIEKIFLVASIILGGFYLLAIPIGRAPDEPAHFWRIYSITQGDTFTKDDSGSYGAYIPQNIIEFGNGFTKGGYKQVAKGLFEPASNEQVFRKTINNNPIDYAPQIVGMSIGRMFNFSRFITLYLSRLFGLIFCITIIYFCLKHIPILKEPLFFISCLPLSMQTFISISYDGVIFCSAISIITIILCSIYNQTFKLTNFRTFLLTILCIALIAVKPVYFPLCIFLFFIPTRCFKNRKQKIILVTSILLVTIGVYLTWNMLSPLPLDAGNSSDAHGQISFILQDPIRYMSILISNIINAPITYLYRLVALEWLDVYTDEFYTIGIVIFFIILCVKERFTIYRINLPKNFHLFSAIIGVASTILVFTGLYIQWTGVGSYIIEGVQTRYLLPILIIIPMICLPSISARSTKIQNTILPAIYLYSFILFLNLNAIENLIYAHI